MGGLAVGAGWAAALVDPAGKYWVLIIEIVAGNLAIFIDQLKNNRLRQNKLSNILSKAKGLYFISYFKVAC